MATAGARLAQNHGSHPAGGKLWTKIAYGIGGAIAAAALILIAALAHYWVLARPLSASIGGPLTTLLLIAAAIGGLWLGLRYEARKRKLR